MKKLSLYMMALLGLTLTACDDGDYDPEVGPQNYAPESAVSPSDVSMQASVTAINISEYYDADTEAEKPITIGTVAVKEGALPQNTTLKAELEISNDADFTKSAIVEANSLAETNVVTIQPSELENAYFNSISKNPATTTLYYRTILYTVTNVGSSDAAARLGVPGQDYYAQGTITLTPLNRVTIAPAYYIVGGPNSDWAASAANRSIKFSHSDEDVYVDPVFTVIFDAAEGDTWFAIGDDEACDAIGEGVWNKLYGIVGGDSEATSGSLDRRYNLGSDNAFCVKAGAKKIRVTIDMMESTFTVETINIADAYYLIGGPISDWAGSATSRAQKFSHSDKSVFEDPVFTYMFDGTGGEMWFAFGDDESCEGIANGDWSKVFGTTLGNGESGFSGTFARREKLNDDGLFKVDGLAKHYRMTINMMEMTYEITPLNFESFVYFIGATDGWGAADQKLALTDEAAGIYTGFLYCADPNGWGNEFKFQKEAGNWDTEINSAHFTGGITGDFGTVDGNTNIAATAGEGVYYVTLDMGTMTLSAVRINNMNLVGDFNNWSPSDAAQQMTWDAENFCYVINGAGVNASGWKFTANDGWDINLGGATLDDLVANGANITAVGSTIKLYPTRKTSEKIYCTVE